MESNQSHCPSREQKLKTHSNRGDYRAQLVVPPNQPAALSNQGAKPVAPLNTKPSQQAHPTFGGQIAAPLHNFRA